jgi:hypothetical protein
MEEIAMYSLVALLQDKPDCNLIRGQVGTVVEQWVPGVYVVDFVDNDGHTYALETLRSDELIRLQHGPLEQVA